ncbi:MAG: choice-of-anchor R domain-containing protein [Verrucomicrobiota bacterium]
MINKPHSAMAANECEPHHANPVHHAFAQTPLLLAAALFASIAGTHAAVLVSNLGTTRGGTPGYEFATINNPSLGVGQDVANSFTTGNSATPLGSITLTCAGGFGSGFSAFLFSDATGVPGTSLTTLSGRIDPYGGGTFDYAPSSAFTLQANTTYWAVLSGINDGAAKRFPHGPAAPPVRLGL